MTPLFSYTAMSVLIHLLQYCTNLAVDTFAGGISNHSDTHARVIDLTPEHHESMTNKFANLGKPNIFGHQKKVR